MLPFSYVIYAYAFALTGLLSLALTALVRAAALRWHILDHPGDRKGHGAPVPLLGGVAIVAAFYAVVLLHIVPADFPRFERYADSLLAFLGEDSRTRITGVLAGAFIIFLVGLVDDFLALRPAVKLAGQCVAAGVLVLADVRLELFILTNWWLSAAVTMFWVLLIVNAMNFLDNMDGLCGGVAIIAAFSFFLAVQDYEQELVRLAAMVFAGSAAGFLYFNSNPARIFMGDAGSMFCGFLLAAIALLGTYHIETTPSRISVVAPVLALSVPLFDIVTVVWIRWRGGHPIWRGDQRHFSHRLVNLGMTHRQAVHFIYIVAIVAGMGSAVLPRLTPAGTIIILAQTAGVFLLIMLLMRTGGSRESAKL